MKKGIIYLVGAGPGDSGLITVKGKNCIAKADVIIYDYLVNKSILQHAKPDAQIIYAGKKANNHTLSQESINSLLVEKANEGKVVCRLKGGDPFLFGRGGEEALVLKNAGIKYEVVPGVSAAMSVPAYAGIPVTHRGITSTFGVVTGHEDPTKEGSDIDWSKVATGMGTLVFFMGVRNLSVIAKKLVENGRPKTTPVALIRQGTTPNQKTVVGTLKNIAKEAQKADMKPPALIVVGEVVNLRKDLEWFESRPLFGKKVVVTRARAQISELAAKFEELGAEVIEFPTIKIAPPENPDALRIAVAALTGYDWVVLTSINGVDALMENIHDMGGDARAFGKAKICAIGPATAARLKTFGLIPDLIPEKYVAESVLEVLEDWEDIEGKKYLLPRADIARPTLRQELEGHGAIVDEVVAYKTILEDPSQGRAKDLLLAGEVDVVTFTSSSTAKNFVKILGKENTARMAGKVKFASIGPITSKTMEELGLPVHIQAGQYDTVGLLNGVVDYFDKKKQGD